MSTAVAAGPVAPGARRPPVAAVLIVGLAVLAGLAVGDPSPTWWLPLAALAGGAVMYAAMRWPFTGLLLMLGSSILLVVVQVSGLRSVNVIDVLLLPVLLASVFGTARQEVLARDRRGSVHAGLQAAERRFKRATILYFALAAVSLVQLVPSAGVGSALDSGLILLRALQGLALYPLCTWWLRSQDRIDRAWSSIYLAGAALALTNIIGVAAWGVKRAGMTLYLNDPEAPFSSPNEAGTATLIIGVVLLVRHAMRPDWKNYVLGALTLLVLALTQSRSALLAWVTFGLLTLRWVRPSRLLAGGAAVAALLPFLPQTFWERMSRSVVLERGSFEAMSLFQRIYGWRTAWSVFQDHPWTGVGYLGYRFVSDRYNELRLVLITVENYYFEVLVSMGVVGLATLVLVLVMLIRLGREVGRIAPPGTLAHHMARYHTPLMMGLLVANLTGNNFVGMVGVAQVAMWTAVLVQSGHAAAAEGARG